MHYLEWTFHGCFLPCFSSFGFFSLKLPVQLVLITTEVESSNPGRGEEYLIQHYVITFFCDLRKVGCVLWVLRFPQTNQTNHHDIAEILFESGVIHHNHRNKISDYFSWNIIIPLCHLFTCDNKIPDNPTAAPLPPFTYMPLRRGVLVQPYVIKFVGDLR